MSVDLFLVVRLVMERTATIAALEARAEAITRMVHPARVQPHTRQLPSEAELDAARFAADQLRFAARQMRVAADDVRGGLHFPDGEEADVQG